MIRASEQDGAHPRPALLRPGFVVLDREVGFAFDDDDRGVAERWFDRADAFDRRILLPFSPESPASGIGETAPHRVVWYRVPLDPADLVAAGTGERLVLHFGAVDRVADVWVDGTHVGRHEGGQTAFAFDVTDAAGPAPVVVVRAEDDPVDPAVPRGKQDWHDDPHSIWYHRVTGIWRSVWLEAVAQVRVVDAVWTADLPAARLTGELTLSRAPGPGAAVEVRAALGDRALARVEVGAESADVVVEVPLAALRNGQAVEEFVWSPSAPRLVDLAIVVRVGGQIVDEVSSYAGLRSVGVGDGRMLLNDRPVLLRSVLEQGYWPETHYTPPSPAAMREEVELILRLGFDSVRIHQKTEDPRFLYWCDRLGLTVWCEAASAYAFTPAAIERYTADWVRIVRAYRSHPSVVAWVPFNESWGIQHVAHDARQRAYARGLSDLTRALDGTRPVISNDGWEHVGSDAVTLHDYDASAAGLTARYGSPDALREVVDGRGLHGRRSLLAEHPGLPVLVTEFGGVHFDSRPTDEAGWGYSAATTSEDFGRRVGELIGALRSAPALGGWCYTQLTDTAQERNGLCDERRAAKLPVEVLREIVTGRSAPADRS